MWALFERVDPALVTSFSGSREKDLDVRKGLGCSADFEEAVAIYSVFEYQPCFLKVPRLGHNEPSRLRS